VAVDPDFRTWIEDTLGRVRPVRTRAMFGGLGIWSGELFFALADDGVLYLKGDAETREAMEQAGSSRFHPYGSEGPAMDYWTVPAEVLEDPMLLGEWVDRAVEVAMRGKQKKRRPSR